MDIFGVRMPKEPKIAQMDWRSLGYWPVWKDGRIVWEKEEVVEKKNK
jgi:hypothetical protein